MVADRLLGLNRAFYRKLSGPFARSRARPQPGFHALLGHLPQPCPRLLDVGCGEGRLGRFLQTHEAIGEYVGVDFSPHLLARAQESVVGTFKVCDIARPGCLQGLATFPAVACLAVLQHIPLRANRLRLLQEMAQHLAPQGVLLLSTWQFMDSERQRRKIVDWSEIGLTSDDVEAGDYLLTWQGGGFGLRYVCLIDEEEIDTLSRDAGLQIVHQFRSDGKEGNLNLYTILAHEA